MRTRKQRYTYGTHGTPTTDALCQAWSALAGAAGTVLVPSGLFAIIAGADHRRRRRRPPSRHRRRLPAGAPLLRHRPATLGVETTYYDPAVGAGIGALIRPNSRAVLVEAPGSQSLDMQDIPAIAAAAHERGVCVIMDNTWATPLLFEPHAHGVDLAVEAGTKYLSGHSDLLLGLVSANAAW